MASIPATRRGQWHGREVRAHMTDLARELGSLRTVDGTPPWVRLHYVYPYPHVDQVIPLMAEGLLTPYLDIPFQHAAPSVPQAHAPPRQRGQGARADRRLARRVPRDRNPQLPSSSASRGRPRRTSNTSSPG